MADDGALAEIAKSYSVDFARAFSADQSMFK
jgi:hypothetical protein